MEENKLFPDDDPLGCSFGCAVICDILFTIIALAIIALVAYILSFN